ncbi:hypothetical protein [Pseudoalteromonas piscicida]|uniref:Uncharacterized protein n=1 Tax=Pseudoalteromonas piscicida TaxID=43662 RepID=A0A2A5JV26_PSEO7|nr:hypothetical protein [Pseudoalteromonas piscicida]PCK33179.1 hypothetical protein CEX98_03180 [Pseudoalteromonas piscicida]
MIKRMIAAGAFALANILSLSAHAAFNSNDARDDQHNYYKGHDATSTWYQTQRYKGLWRAQGNPLYENNTLHKYAGPSATASNKHAPLAVTQGNFTYFIVNGESEYYPRYIGQEPDKQTSTPPIAYLVGKYDHVNDVLYPPTTIHVKGTTDQHDNAVINLDNEGYIYVFISGRNEKRGGLIYKSDNPYNTDSFSLVYSKKYPLYGLDSDCDPDLVGNEFGFYLCKDHHRGFTYPQAWWVGDKFILIHTIYLPLTYLDQNASPSYMRAIYASTVTPSDNGVIVSDPKKLIAIKGTYTKGHYSISTEKNGTIGVAFNVHMKDQSTFKGNPLYAVDNRTNLYFMYSKDGNDWFNIQGTKVVSNLLDSGVHNRGLTKPEELHQVAVREYHNPVTGQTNETNWCDDWYAALGKAQPNNYICRRIYLKALDMEVDSSGTPSKVDILYGASRSVENLQGTEYGPYPSSQIDSSDIYLARYFYSNATQQWDGERILLDGKDIIDHAYTSGTIYRNNGKTTIVTPASYTRDGHAGQEQVMVFENTTGAKGNWTKVADMYQQPLSSQLTANFVVNVHNGKGNFKVMWSEGTKTEGEVKLVIGNEQGQLFKLPDSSAVPATGQQAF